MTIADTSGPVDRLLGAMRDELEALDSGDPAWIMAATQTKMSALGDVRDDVGERVPVDRLREAQSLNALASTRVNMLLAGVGRRLAALVAADGRTASLCYGRDGRTESRR